MSQGTKIYACTTFDNCIFFNKIIFFRDRKNLDSTRVNIDETRVKNVMKTIKTMINPFDNYFSNLVHSSSGKVATKVVAKDMRTMYDRGKAKADRFLKENVAGKEPNIHATISKTNLRTFSSMGKNEKRRNCSIEELKSLFQQNVTYCKISRL